MKCDSKYAVIQLNWFLEQLHVSWWRDCDHNITRGRGLFIYLHTMSIVYVVLVYCCAPMGHICRAAAQTSHTWDDSQILTNLKNIFFLTFQSSNTLNSARPREHICRWRFRRRSVVLSACPHWLKAAQSGSKRVSYVWSLRRLWLVASKISVCITCLRNIWTKN